MRISPLRLCAALPILAYVSCTQWDAPTGMTSDPANYKALVDSIQAAKKADPGRDTTVIAPPIVKDTAIVPPIVKDTVIVPPIVKDTTVGKDTGVVIGNPVGGLTTLAPASIFLATDLEDQNTSCWNNRNSSGMATSSCGVFSSIGFNPFQLVQGGITHSGKKAIQITYTKNEDAGGTNVSINADSVNVRSYYYFDQGFDFGQGMKIGRVSSFNSAAQVNDVDIIMECRSSGSANQCGATDMRDLGLYFNGAPKGSDWGNVSADISFQRGRWYAIEYQVVLNTPGQSDGKVRLWVDGVKLAEKTNLRIRGNLGSDVKLNTVKIGGWYSNGANGNTCTNPSAPSKIYMDDIVIAKSLVGVMAHPLAGN